jgi:PKD repeat protein
LKLVWKSVLTLVFLSTGLSTLAQNYPMPSKVGQTATICKTDGTGPLFSEACTNGLNSAGEPNAGKPTYQYGGVLTSFVGRYNDSNTTGIVQNKGMRTLRAGKVRIAPSTRGSAPPRVYMQMGETFVSYALSTFFTSTLQAPMIAVNTIPAPRGNQAPWNGRNPFERIAAFDGYFYPEHAASGWSVPIADQTERLRDFDFDDRGNVYVAEDLFGWGIAKDNNETNGQHMTSLSQVIGDAGHGITPYIIFVLKSANKYHAFVTGSESNKLVQFNVTTPTSPTFEVERPNSPRLYRWAKDDDARTLALIDLSGVLKLYDYDQYVLGHEPILTVEPSASDKIIKDAAFDENGTLWAIEASKTVNKAVSGLVVRKLTRSGAGYTETTISNAYSESFYPASVHASAGYVAIAGSAQGPVFDLLLFKAEGSGLRSLDTDRFFRKFYHTAPTGFAQPGSFNRVGSNTSVRIFKHAGKTYLFYSVTGMGDVFELDGGGLSASVRSVPFGTPNPNAPAALTGPFPGDPVTFRATSSAASSQILQWIFGNPEAGGPVNIRSGTTGVDIVHQYTGLSTAGAVTATKTVTASVSGDSSVNDTVSVTLKVPTPRIALKATGELITGSGFETVLGDKFVDASDGSIEGHFATWTIGPTGAPVVTKTQPNEEIPVGLVLGAHTVQYSGSYGKQDSPLTITSPFPTSLASRSYTVLPFLAKIKPATRAGSIVTYGATARRTTDPLLTAAQWTYTWTLTKADGTETASKSDTVPVGTTLPDFPIDKAVLEAANGGKVTLRLTVASGAVPVPAFETYTTFVDVKLPAPILHLSNCGHVNDDCSISVSSATPGDAATWQLSWDVKKGTTPVKTGTGNPLATFKLTLQGTHTVTVTEAVFGVSVSQNFEVGATECGPLPPAANLSAGASCTSGCGVGEEITFTASAFHYDIQACDVFEWNFGDGSSATGLEVTHAYTSQGNKTVTLKLKNSTNTAGVTATIPISIGQVIQNPCDGQTKPTNATFTMSCVSGVTCKAGTTIVFTPKRAGASLLSCDSAQWSFSDGGTSNSKTPSKAFASAGTYTVSVTLTNSNASGSASFSQSIEILPNIVTCSGSASSIHITPTFNGATSGCANGSTTTCSTNETVSFDASFFGYSEQACDKFEWTFGDGATSSVKQAQHSYAANGTYNVQLKVFNSTKPAGATVDMILVVGPKAPAKTPPILAFSQFPAAGAKGTPVTFNVNVTNDISSTGWSWDFGDGVKDSTSQATNIGKSASIQHTYTKTGTFSVTVKARNAEDVVTAETGLAVGVPGIIITDTPEYKYLLPVVVHGPGQNNSVWRTDVQIYTPDPSVSPQTPLNMTAELRDIHRPLEVFNSTFYYDDFMRVFTTAADSGPVIITARTQFAPQIWTRTYNQTDTGTFGQFIPAIRIDAAAGGGSAFGSGKYYLAGLRHDTRFRTNLGFLNPNSQTINATVKVYDDKQAQVGQFTLQLPPFQLDQFPITDAKAVPDLVAKAPNGFTVQIEVPAGQWVIGYASYIDNASGDPVYIQAVRESELSLTDYSSIVVPGVGHVGEWRSDITIFNPDTQSVNVDLTYHDQTGAKIAEAKSVLIHPREFLAYTDFLKQGVLGNVPDSLGILRVTMSSPFPPATYPLAFARTYNDKGTGKTFGQGINGFAVARANVKPGKPALVAGIRSNTKYYTNVGLTNVSNVPVAATVKFLDATTGAEQTIQSHTLQPNQSVVARVIMPNQVEHGSLKIEVTGGNVWGFCSIVDIGTADPEYVAATPLQ